MSPETVLYIPNGFLRPVHESDVTAAYVSGLNDTQVNRYLEIRHSLQTHDSVLSFVRMNIYSSDMILWGLWYGEKSLERLVGTVRLHGINNTEKYCHIGICLFEKTVWGKGLGSHVIRKVTEWAFNNLGLHTVRAGAYAENVGSQHAFLRAGYKFSHKEQLPSSGSQYIAFTHVYLASRG